jgi:hypothetical protein
MAALLFHLAGAPAADALVEFLAAAADKPVYVGFGPWHGRVQGKGDKADFTRVLYTTLVAAGSRAIVHSDVLDAAVPVPHTLDGRILVTTQPIDLEWLFPQCKVCMCCLRNCLDCVCVMCCFACAGCSDPGGCCNNAGSDAHRHANCCGATVAISRKLGLRHAPCSCGPQAKPV